jgi:hypothetical protein
MLSCRCFTLLFLLVSSFPSAFAQGLLLTGHLQDQRTHRPIPFVSLGVIGKNVGTVTDEKGHFSLRIPATLTRDSITFSAIGYQTQACSIAQLATTSPQTFLLREKATALPEVVVRARAAKLRRIGTTTHNPFLWGNVQQKQTPDIVEFAKLIPLANTPSEVRQAHIFLRRPTIDTVTFRLNFYRAGADRPAERLVERTILVHTAIHNGWLTIDLTPYALTLQTDFYLSFEFLPAKQLPVPAFSYGAQLGGAALVRTSSLGTWKREPGASLTAYVTVQQEGR